MEVCLREVCLKEVCLREVCLFEGSLFEDSQRAPLQTVKMVRLPLDNPRYFRRGSPPPPPSPLGERVPLPRFVVGTGSFGPLAASLPNLLVPVSVLVWISLHAPRLVRWQEEEEEGGRRR